MLILSYERTGVIPPALANRPNPGADVLFYLDCYHALARHRPNSGMGLSPVPLPDIKIYADATGFAAPADFLWFSEIIGALDEEFLSFQSKKIESERAQAAAQRNAARGVRK